MDIVGRPPNLAGLLCEALICEGFVCRGEPVENASTVHLRFGGVWHKLILESGVIIWRQSIEAPTPWAIEDLGWQYPHADVGEMAGVIGHRLAHYLMQGAPGGVEVVFSFDNGRTIIVNNANDQSIWRIG